MSEFKRSLTLSGLVMIVIGSCIGSGIFKTPNQIAQALPDQNLILLVWLLGGLIAIAGALTFAELASIFPQAGGVYVYLKEAFGKLPAFLYGWSTISIITSGTIAALSLVFVDYFIVLAPDLQKFKLWVATGMILLLSLISILGIGVSQGFANLFTVLKILGIAVIVFAVLITFAEPLEINPDLVEKPSLLSGFALGLVGVLWSFGGWQHASYLAAEAKNAKKNVAKALVLGVTAVTLIYLVTNWAYMQLLSVTQIANSEVVAATAMESAFSWGSIFISILIIISVFGTAGIYTITAPRMYYAMAKDKVFFTSIAKLHPKFLSPYVAIIIQSSWAIIILWFFESFKEIISLVVFVDWVFLGLAAYGIFRIRKRSLSGSGNFKVPLYPLIPLFFIIAVGAFVFFQLFENPKQLIASSGLLVIGGVLFIFFNRKRTN